MSTTSDPAPVRLDRVGKRYAGTAVLDGVSLDFAAGRVHGLVGENGAGKSTLLRVLCGLTAPDGGRVLVDGRPVRMRGPRDALAHGVALVPQDAALVPALSVLDNVFLGRWARRRSADRERFAALARRAGAELDPDAPVRALSPAERKWTQILRVLALDARVIALDEPAAPFTQGDADRLMALVADLARGGAAVVLVSHLLDQVLAVCDEVSVLRDGRRVLTSPAAEQTPRSLVRHMAGRPVEVRYPEPEPVPVDAPVVLSARGLARAGAVRGVDLDVRAGEIVGLAGLAGSGRSATLRLLAGADRRDAGEI
ncbi:ATP-binding cassette domain-containing protein, partial [Actinomadura roseirufa]|uniref:ATP-binding cassette domain-containing protein n=1 Tax=Actinomadura roseirufa TaxID=2094049 RepID=UPI001041A5F8